MLSTNSLKYIRSLHQRKFRQKYHNFIAEGEKIAGEVLASGQMEVEAVFGLPSWLEANKNVLVGLAERVTEVTENELQKISLLATPNQVLLVLKQPGDDLLETTAREDISLYLEDLRDPGNLGTILRIADWFGIRHVFRSPDSVDAFNPKVVQASMGAFLRVKSPEIALEELFQHLPGLPVIGTMLGGGTVFQGHLPKAALLVIGNESKGISPAAAQFLTAKISIPRHENGGAESLNAAVATGIVCAAFRNLAR